MLGLLCREGTIVEIFLPPAFGPRFCFRVFYKTTLNCLAYSLHENCLGLILCHAFSLVTNLYFLYCDAYVCIVYIDVPTVHWQAIYCGKFTVHETGHFICTMFGQHNTLIISTFIFEAHTES